MAKRIIIIIEQNAVKTSANGDFAGAELHQLGSKRHWDGGSPGRTEPEPVPFGQEPPIDGMKPRPPLWETRYDEREEPRDHRIDGVELGQTPDRRMWEQTVELQQSDGFPELQPVGLLPPEVPIPKRLPERTSTEETDVDVGFATQLAMADPITATGPWPTASSPNADGNGSNGILAKIFSRDSGGGWEIDIG